MVDQLEEGIASFQRCIESRDREAAEAVLHPEYGLVLVHPVKAVMSRIRWLELLPDYLVHSYSVEERVVDVDGDLAAANSPSRDGGHRARGGQERPLRHQ